MDSPSNKRKDAIAKLRKAIQDCRKETAELKKALEDPNTNAQELLSDPEFDNLVEKVQVLETQLKLKLGKLLRTKNSPFILPCESKTREPQRKPSSSLGISFAAKLGKAMTIGSFFTVLMNLVVFYSLTNVHKLIGFQSAVPFSWDKFAFITGMMFVSQAAGIFGAEILPPTWELIFHLFFQSFVISLWRLKRYLKKRF